MQTLTQAIADADVTGAVMQLTGLLVAGAASTQPVLLRVVGLLPGGCFRAYSTCDLIDAVFVTTSGRYMPRKAA